MRDQADGALDRLGALRVMMRSQRNRRPDHQDQAQQRDASSKMSHQDYPIKGVL
jgi:hypothetical protein